MTATPCRVGVLGLGLMGQRMLRSMAAHDRFEVVRGHDPEPDRAAIADAYGGVLPLADEAEVIGADDIDLVYVASPPTAHVPQALAALNAGKPVFCEKPLTTDLAAGERLVACARELGLATAVNFPFATLPGLEAIEREMAGGRAQRIEIVLHFSQWPRTWHTAGPWLDGRTEGGFLREVFSHFAYLTRRVAGPLEIVHSAVNFDDGAHAETSACAVLRAGGTPVFLTAGAGGAAPDFNGWTWYGAERAFRLRDWSQVDRATATEPWTPLPVPAVETRRSAQLDALARRLDGEPSPLPDMADALDVAVCVEGLFSQAAADAGS